MAQALGGSLTAVMDVSHPDFKKQGEHIIFSCTSDDHYCFIIVVVYFGCVYCTITRASFGQDYQGFRRSSERLHPFGHISQHFTGQFSLSKKCHYSACPEGLCHASASNKAHVFA